MKTRIAILAVMGALWMSVNASAAVVVHAGPVHVGVGVGRPAHRPVIVRPRPVVARPVVARPIVAAPRPVLAPVVRPVPVAVPTVAASTGVVPATGADLTDAATRARIRAARLRHAIHQEAEAAVEHALQHAN